MLAKKRKLEQARNKSLNAAGGAQTSASGAIIKKTININNLPSMAPETVKPVVSNEFYAVNPKLEAMKKKKARNAFSQGGVVETDQDRPNSGRSGMTAMTGGLTNALTAVTGG